MNPYVVLGWGVMITLLLLAGSMDYADRLELDACKKELRPKRESAYTIDERWARRSCPGGFVTTYSDAGPKLTACLNAWGKNGPKIPSR